MTDKTDKKEAAAEAKIEAKQDAAYEKYEKDQATYEKTKPGEINEPAYAKYEAAYDKAEAKPAMPADVSEPPLPKDVTPGHLAPRAVKFNVPSHPGYAPGVPTDDESQTVHLFHTGETGTERVYTRVHPLMEGDYLRAGWSKA